MQQEAKPDSSFVGELRLRVSFVGIVLGAIRVGTVVFVLMGTYLTLFGAEYGGVYSGKNWWGFLIDGITRGSVYALIALGYTMVYGVLGFINFAHGEVFMGGTMVGYIAADQLLSAGIWEANPVFSLVVILAVAMTVSTSLAVLLERVAYRPLRDSPRLISLITAIGASFFLQYTFSGLFSSNRFTYPAVEFLTKSTTVFGIGITNSKILAVGTTLLVMGGLFWLVERTRTGRSMRAVAEDKEIAALMGIDVNRTIVTTFAVGGAMAGFAGFVWAVVYRTVDFFTGFLPGIKAFTAAVIGGIGNIPGAMLGGIILGVLESGGPPLLLTGFGIPGPHQLADVVAFSFLVLVLVFRPTGLLGEQLSERA